MRIGLCTGCFDVLHIGHIRLFKYAKDMCDLLIIGINSDDSVRKLKGNDRPINTQDIRKEFLLNLKNVDDVYIFNEISPYILIKDLQPDLFFKGKDYDLNKLKNECRYSMGTQIIQFDLVEGYSTTNIINK